MTDEEMVGILRRQPTGLGAVCRPARQSVEITPGELFRVEVDGELKPTRMEYQYFAGPTRDRKVHGQYYARRLRPARQRARDDWERPMNDGDAPQRQSGRRCASKLGI